MGSAYGLSFKKSRRRRIVTPVFRAVMFAAIVTLVVLGGTPANSIGSSQLACLVNPTISTLSGNSLA